MPVTALPAPRPRAARRSSPSRACGRRGARRAGGDGVAAGGGGSCRCGRGAPRGRRRSCADQKPQHSSGWRLSACSQISFSKRARHLEGRTLRVTATRPLRRILPNGPHPVRPRRCGRPDARAVYGTALRIRTQAGAEPASLPQRARCGTIGLSGWARGDRAGRSAARQSVPRIDPSPSAARRPHSASCAARGIRAGAPAASRGGGPRASQSASGPSTASTTSRSVISAAGRAST